jgi:hypothetical protein
MLVDMERVAALQGSAQETVRQAATLRQPLQLGQVQLTVLLVPVGNTSARLVIRWPPGASLVMLVDTELVVILTGSARESAQVAAIPRPRLLLGPHLSTALVVRLVHTVQQ